MSLLASISIKGVLSARLVEGTINSAIFHEILSNEIIMILNANSLVIMNNARIHHTEEIKSLLSQLLVFASLFSTI